MAKPGYRSEPPAGYPTHAGFPDGSHARGRALPPAPYTRPGPVGGAIRSPAAAHRGLIPDSPRRRFAERDYLVQVKAECATGHYQWVDYTAHFDRHEAEAQRAELTREGELARVIFAPKRPKDDR